MARRYLVHQTFSVNNPNDSSGPVVDEMVDLALLLSQRVGRNVRQGRSFRLHSVKASIRPKEGLFDDADLGMSISGEVYHAPANKHSVKAWNDLFKVWRKQKSLKLGAIGPNTRFDDFEVGWNTTLTSSRTSTLKQSGLDDADWDKVCIYGASAEAGLLSTYGVSTMQDYWNSIQGDAAKYPSRYALGSTTVKDPKFTAQFPQAVSTPFTAVHSSMNTGVGGDSGANASLSHVHVADTATLCGVLRVKAWSLAEDTAAFDADTFSLQLSFEVSMGVSLLPSAKKKRKAPRRTYRRKTSRRRYRRRKA